MPRLPAAERSAECASLATKVRTYVSEASVKGHSAQRDLYGLPEYATELAERSDRTTLLGLAREVDRWLREIHEPSEALLLVAKMRGLGVRDSELPVLASAKRLQAITARGVIISRSEATLVQSTLVNAELAKLLGARSIQLSTMLAKWQTGRACG
jgi:hypothetical protein